MPDDVLAFYREAGARGAAARTEWEDAFAAWRAAAPDAAAALGRAPGAREPAAGLGGRPAGLRARRRAVATRVVSGAVINALAPFVPTHDRRLGRPRLVEQHAHQGRRRLRARATTRGRNVCFGVREHAMAAAANGMALHGGVIPYAATFFVFTDYQRPALRLGALMGAPVKYVFTHDSIGLGEDGPTHQPVEHLAILRATPNFTVIRPADANETVEAWKFALHHERRTGGARPHPPEAAGHRPHPLRAGGRPCPRRLRAGRRRVRSMPELILIATGSEVHLALEAHERLVGRGRALAGREHALPRAVLRAGPGLSRRRAAAAGRRAPLRRGRGDLRLARRRRRPRRSRSGSTASAPRRRPSDLFEAFGFTVDNVYRRARALLGG